MGFLEPSPPPFDLEEWKAKPHLTRLKPLVQDWGVNGFGSPTFVYLVYVVKLIIFSVAALFVISLTPGLGSLGNLGDWWTEPIVFEKLAVWMLLWEILGLGAGSMPLSFRFVPPIGGALYWLRPGTVRLPPWPEVVPFTKGTTRTAVDVLLYAGVVATGIFLLAASGVDAGAGSAREAAARGDRGAARSARSARSARQGLVPRCAARDLRHGPDRRAVPGPALDRGLAVRPLLHLVGGGVVQAQPPLPVRRLDDDEQRAADSLAWLQAEAVAALPGGHAAVAAGGGDRPLRHGPGVPLAAVADQRRQRHDSDDRDRRDDPLPPEHHLDVPPGGAARVEPVHDLRAALPVRALRRRAALDSRRSAADRGPRDSAGRAARRGRPAAGQDQLSAVDALLRGQLGDDRLALPEGERGRGEARFPHQEAGEDHRRAGRKALRPGDGPSSCSTRGCPSVPCTRTGGR